MQPHLCVQLQHPFDIMPDLPSCCSLHYALLVQEEDWSGESLMLPSASHHLLLDLNDPHMTFEVIRSKDLPRMDQVIANKAAATILPAAPLKVTALLQSMCSWVCDVV